ncbi:GWT1 domain containing protein [Trichuris trichiura]|uniref:GWT1 domain containing protein n=1 Tax=Trichuris trichiura TaxID=36087 RepID=A0A077ZNA4_TRITR|nr:GWT1 domain containing protein [Trichuris trichiura]
MEQTKPAHADASLASGKLARFHRFRGYLYFQLIGEFAASRLHVSYANAIVGVAIALAVQVFLQGDEVQEYLFQELRYRENGLFSLNREGIVSVVGCLAIFHIATDVGRLLYGCRRHRWNVAYIGKGIACLIIIVTMLCCGLDSYGLSPSRRIAYWYYVFWIALLSFTDVFLLLMVTVIAFLFYYRNGLHTNMRSEDYYYLYDGNLWQAINASGLSYFLLCNVFTGIVKMSTSTVERMSVQTSLAVIFCYALATSLFARSQWGHLEAI